MDYYILGVTVVFAIFLNIGLIMFKKHFQNEFKKSDDYTRNIELTILKMVYTLAFVVICVSVLNAFFSVPYLYFLAVLIPISIISDLIIKALK